MWLPTVTGEMNSRRAIALVDRPWRSRSRTSAASNAVTPT
jgi:hypothetical protein